MLSHQNPSFIHTSAQMPKIDLCQKSGSGFFDIHSMTVKKVYTASDQYCKKNNNVPCNSYFAIDQEKNKTK